MPKSKIKIKPRPRASAPAQDEDSQVQLYKQKKTRKRRKRGRQLKSVAVQHEGDEQSDREEIEAQAAAGNTGNRATRGMEIIVGSLVIVPLIYIFAHVFGFLFVCTIFSALAPVVVPLLCLVVGFAILNKVQDCGKVQEFVDEGVKPKVKEDILLYSEKNYKGLRKSVYSWDLNPNFCYNLDESQNNFAASIDTQGECIYVFKESNCHGKNLKISSESDLQRDLSLWGFDKAVSSIQTCWKHDNLYMNSHSNPH